MLSFFSLYLLRKQRSHSLQMCVVCISATYKPNSAQLFELIIRALIDLYPLSSSCCGVFPGFKKNNWTEINKSWPDFPSPSPYDFLITWLPSFSSWLGRSIAALKVKRGQPSFFQWYYEEASEQINHLHWQDQPCLAAISHVSYHWVGE